MSQDKEKFVRPMSRVLAPARELTEQEMGQLAGADTMNEMPGGGPEWPTKSWNNLGTHRDIDD